MTAGPQIAGVLNLRGQTPARCDNPAPWRRVHARSRSPGLERFAGEDGNWPVKNMNSGVEPARLKSLAATDPAFPRWLPW